jgi:aldose 1-epimerase
MRYAPTLAALTFLLHPSAADAGITKALWGTAPDGGKIDIYTLSNANGMQVQISTYSGTIVSIRVPDRNGNMSDVLMSHPDLAAYLKEDSGGRGGRYGEVIGRFANRIGGAQFALEGKTYHLATANNAKDQIHGGPENLSSHRWMAASRDSAEPSLILTVKSPDGDQGFPGNVTVRVTYTLTRDNALNLDYRATTDAPTVMNLTNHAYFNLKGEGDVTGTAIQLFAGQYTPPGPGSSLPSGEIRSVKDTPYDFTTPQLLGDRLAQLAEAQPAAADSANGARPPNIRAPGYDTNMIIDGKAGTLRIAARVLEPSTGRILEVWTTQPGFQFFTPGAPRDLNFVQRGFGARPAFCIETEHYPDSPNHPNFPTTEITPEKPLHEVTVFRFGTDKVPMSPLGR